MAHKQYVAAQCLTTRLSLLTTCHHVSQQRGRDVRQHFWHGWLCCQPHQAWLRHRDAQLHQVDRRPRHHHRWHCRRLGQVRLVSCSSAHPHDPVPTGSAQGKRTLPNVHGACPWIPRPQLLGGLWPRWWCVARCTLTSHHLTGSVLSTAVGANVAFAIRMRVEGQLSQLEAKNRLTAWFEHCHCSSLCCYLGLRDLGACQSPFNAFMLLQVCDGLVVEVLAAADLLPVLRAWRL